MASTVALSVSINYAKAFVRQSPLTGVGGVANQPALNLGDMVRQLILSPPFAWRWNRATTTIVTVTGTQDYVVALSNFGWLEKASFAFAGNQTRQLQIDLDLAESNTQEQPTHIAARLDDNAGNITFRFLPVPEQAYSVVVTYQKSAPTFAATTDFWTPIPDWMFYIYNQGFLAKALEYWGDPRFQEATQLFFRSLVSASSGLESSQINIFLPPQGLPPNLKQPQQ